MTGHFFGKRQMVMWGQRMNALVKMGYNALAGYGTMRLRPHRNGWLPKLEVGPLKSQQTRWLEDSLRRWPIVSELLTSSGCSLKWVYVNVKLPAELPVKSPRLLLEREHTLDYSLVHGQAPGGCFCGWRNLSRLCLCRRARWDNCWSEQITA